MTKEKHEKTANGGGWVIHNKRYDLTDFVKRHPGGEVAMRLGEGRNCTEMFVSYHRMVDEEKVKTILEKYYVEDVLPGDPLYDTDFQWESTPFYDELTMKVKGYFVANNLSHKAPWSKWVYLVFMTSAVFYCYYAFVCGEWWTLLVMPSLYWMSCSAMMHDGAHFAMSNSPAVNKFCSYFGSAHVSLTSWYHQHVIGHHSKTNMADKDPDHYHFKMFSKMIWGFRTHWSHRWKPAYLLWRRGLMFMSTLTTFGPAYLLDLNGIRTGVFNQVVPYMRMSTWDVVAHFLGRVALLFMLVGLPYVLFPFGKAVLFATVPYAVHGILYYMFSQVSHVNEHCLKKHRGLHSEWAVHQVQHSHDWSPRSRLASLASIGLNTQTIHHLFPSIESHHYAELTDILQECCANHGVGYEPSSSLWEALMSHFGYIQFVNEGFRDGVPRPTTSETTPFPAVEPSKSATEPRKRNSKNNKSVSAQPSVTKKRAAAGRRSSRSTSIGVDRFDSVVEDFLGTQIGVVMAKLSAFFSPPESV